MKIPRDLPQFNDNHALMAVIAREQGVLYRLQDGTIERIVAINEPHARFSDREGFFAHGSIDRFWGAGEPHDGAVREERAVFIRQIVRELRSAIRTNRVTKVYLFEPKYLKGGISRKLASKEMISIVPVRYGNFVDTEPLELLRYIHAKEIPSKDLSDPASVHEEEGAEEKRKILSVGRQIHTKEK